MRNPSPNRVAIDALGTGEVTVRCSCRVHWTITVLSIGTYVKLGADEALRIADGLCPCCSRKEAPHAP